jgi:hypothetical protein
VGTSLCLNSAKLLWLLILMVLVRLNCINRVVLKILLVKVLIVVIWWLQRLTFTSWNLTWRVG